jgi:hypothetical protein
MLSEHVTSWTPFNSVLTSSAILSLAHWYTYYNPVTHTLCAAKTKHQVKKPEAIQVYAWCHN